MTRSLMLSMAFVALGLSAGAVGGCQSTARGATAADTVFNVPDTPTAETTGTTGEDSTSGDTQSGAETAGPSGPKPADAAALTFVADDRQNRTYKDGDIQWTGSFVWDKATNLLTFSASWLPTEREWPRLYDDGPLSEKGHEAEGQTKGDGIYSTEVWVRATEEVTFEFGALNEFSRWIWIGPNGTITVKPGDTARTAAGSLAFPKFGDVDVKVALDVGKLHEQFKTLGANGGADTKVYVKGTMNSWTPIQLLDNGKKGDEKAGDGVFTYLQSEKLGAHDGLAFVGQHVQFVFVFAALDAEPEAGQEYKFPIDALPDGVRVWTGRGGTWKEEPVVLEPDSYGKVKNTAVVVTDPGGSVTPECAQDTPCATGFECVSGKCVATTTPECAQDKPCTAPTECVAGKCVTVAECSDQKPCTDGKLCQSGSCVEPECSETKACPDAYVCKAGHCVPKGGAKPSVALVDPNKGGAGTLVTISGAGFVEGATVTFGGKSATEVTFKTVGTLTCVTPDAGPGPVTVTVTNPGGAAGSYVGGFTYADLPKGFLVSDVQPPYASVLGGTVIAVKGNELSPTTTVSFGDTAATKVTWMDATWLEVTAPLLPLGPVTLTAKDQGKTATFKTPFHTGWLFSPTIDGALDEWPKSFLHADDTAATGWDSNDLDTLRVAFDGEGLSLGIAGTLEAGNAIVVYVDLDYGKATGVLPSAVTDTTDALDDALSATGITVLDPKFGAELAVGCVGPTEVSAGQGLSATAGVRLLSKPGDLAWVDGAVRWVAGTSVELRIPWKAAGVTPIAGGRTLGLFVRIVDKTGAYVNPEGLPSSAAKDGSVDSVFTLWVP